MTNVISARAVAEQRVGSCPGPIADLLAMYRRPNDDDVVELVSVEERDRDCLVVLQVRTR